MTQGITLEIKEGQAEIILLREELEALLRYWQKDEIPEFERN
jgi:hypothetical protein